MALIFKPSNNLYHSLPRNSTSHLLRTPSFYTPISCFRLPQSPNQTQSSDDKFIIVGGSKLSGHVHISGSKNSALAVLAGTLCCSGNSKLHNIPNVSDIRTMILVLESLGVEVDVYNGEVTVDTHGIRSLEPCADAVGKIRAGFFVGGPLLARFGEAMVALPGGCDIGARPIDIYVRGFRALGATVEMRQRQLYACAKNGRLIGGKFRLDFPSVGATETLMMAASMADGVTVLSNVAQEPEVVDLAQFLTHCGASVEGAGSPTLVINGRKKLQGPEYSIIPDRIEAGTFMLAAAITRSCFSMSPIIPCHLSAVMDKLSVSGCQIIQKTPNTLEIAATSKTRGSLQGFSIRTGPYPHFPTDLQPQTTVLLTICNGSNIVEELVFEERMGHVRELEKLGARIRVSGSTALVYGKDQGSWFLRFQCCCKGSKKWSCTCFGGMAAEGITEIEGVTHIDRGYENLEMKLHSLGADTVRRPSSLETQL
ncbi:hypothetical protein IFM89_014043 [Coptis chinensis]|uniref:UDP-N-acetylglucosamine 1-carboxyvinyltransferase n=1 Tax=Coptis chinensis TaxID=261450 RepID=A0A835LY14_9MAGN|nr:hypothetical protein IFM89_014043 [Coptis chinensis]